MNERTEKNLTVIENKELIEKNKEAHSKTVGHTTNPIAKKLMEFRQNQIARNFSVKDLFKK